MKPEDKKVKEIFKILEEYGYCAFDGCVNTDDEDRAEKELKEDIKKILKTKVRSEEEIRAKLQEANDAKFNPKTDQDYFEGPVYSGVIQALEWVLGMMDDDL